VFCANDLLALSLLQELTRRGLRVPATSPSSATTTSSSPSRPRSPSRRSVSLAARPAPGEELIIRESSDAHR